MKKKIYILYQKVRKKGRPKVEGKNQVDWF